MDNLTQRLNNVADELRHSRMLVHFLGAAVAGAVVFLLAAGLNPSALQTSLVSIVSALVGVFAANGFAVAFSKGASREIADTVNLAVGEAETRISRLFSDRLEEVLSTGGARALLAESADNIDYKKLWHFYYVTEWKEPSSGTVRKFWRTVLIDLTNCHSTRHLTTKVWLQNQYGEKEPYVLDAAGRDQRFTMMFDAEEDAQEPTLVATFVATSAKGPLAGLFLLRTWTGSQFLSPCVLSQKPLVADASEQSPISDELSGPLQTTWNDNFHQYFSECFPLTKAA